MDKEKAHSRHSSNIKKLGQMQNLYLDKHGKLNQNSLTSLQAALKNLGSPSGNSILEQ